MNMVLLVVDTQKLIVTEELYQYMEFINNIKVLLSAARNHSVEVIYVRHDDGIGEQLTKGTEEFEIYEGFAPKDSERIFDKKVNSAFRDTGLLAYLKDKNEADIMIVGLQTDYCIDATIKCGFEHGFHMIVPAHTNSTVDNEFMTGEQTYNYYNNKMWNKRYARCIPFEDALQLLQNPA
jgi:nicotinamidase-related amidase